MALGKGIPLINGFDLNAPLPLDSRAVADTKEAMNALIGTSVTDGQICYCKEDSKLYVLKSGAWEEVGGNGGIPVVEGTLVNVGEDGMSFSFTIPEAQTSYFILHSVNDIFNEMYVGMDVVGGQYLGSLILVSGNVAYELLGESTNILMHGNSGIFSLIYTKSIDYTPTSDTFTTIINLGLTYSDLHAYTYIVLSVGKYIVYFDKGVYVEEGSTDYAKLYSIDGDGYLWELISAGSGSEATLSRMKLGSDTIIHDLGITFNRSSTTTLTDEQVSLIKSYDKQYVYVKFDTGISADNAYIGYVFNFGELGYFIGIVSQVNLEGNIVYQSLIHIINNTATYLEEKIDFLQENKGKFLKTNSQGKPEWDNVPTITFLDD